MIKLVPKVCWISCVTEEMLRHTQIPTDRLNETTKRSNKSKMLRLYFRFKYVITRFPIHILHTNEKNTHIGWNTPAHVPLLPKEKSI